ncbi:MAG: FtsX-like permease family protein, partial [Pseudomonadota bacterium]
TGTPWDRAVIVPIEAVWSVHGLADGHAPVRQGQDPAQAPQIGPPFDAAYFPGTPAVVLHAEALATRYALQTVITRRDETMAFFPGSVLADLYRVLGDMRQAISLLASVAQGLVAASVLIGLFLLIRLFQRHLALLQVLGAPRRFVFAVVWCYATSLLAGGTLLGLVLGWAGAWGLSQILSARMDIALSPSLGWQDLHLAAAGLSLATSLALLPAWRLMRLPVVAALRA